MTRKITQKGFTRTPKFGVSSQSERGFTLVETMIYIALFAVIMSGAVVGTYNLLAGSDKNIMATGVQEEGTFVNRKINWALYGGTAVAVSGGGTTISVTRPDLGAQSPLVVMGNGSSITLKRGAGVAVELNSDRFKVTNTSFAYTPSSNGRPASVYTNFQIGSKIFSFRTYLRQ